MPHNMLRRPMKEESNGRRKKPISSTIDRSEHTAYYKQDVSEATVSDSELSEVCMAETPK